MSAPTATGHFGVTTRITRVGFADGWTGAVAIGTIAYVAAAIWFTLSDLPPSPALDFYRLISDQPAAFAATLLAIVAARSAQQPAARRTWKFLAAAIVTYNLGNLIDAFLRIADLTPFPSLADLFYLAFFPVLISGIYVLLRASSLRVSWGRLVLDSLILVLGFGTFFWFFVISPAAAASEEELARFVLTQVYIALDCLMLMAIGVLLMNATACPLRKTTVALLAAGFALMFLADIVWAASVVVGEYISGDNFSDVLYLACYAALASAAQVQIRDKSRPERQRSASPSRLHPSPTSSRPPGRASRSRTSGAVARRGAASCGGRRRCDSSTRPRVTMSRGGIRLASAVTCVTSLASAVSARSSSSTSAASSARASAAGVGRSLRREVIDRSAIA